MSHPHGRPVTVMKFSDTGEVLVDNEELEKIFNHEEIQDRKAVVISLIGAFRGGKSYLLNYCLRFLYANVSFNAFICSIFSKFSTLINSIHQSTNQRKDCLFSSIRMKTGWEKKTNH